MGDLFDYEPPAGAPEYPDAPGHRGVATSVAAAADLQPKLGRLQNLVLEAIRNAGPEGLTADETCEALGLDRWTVQPRTSELRRYSNRFTRQVQGRAKTTQQTSTSTQTVANAKLPYSPPQLTHYGPMDRLVQSGTSGSDDGAGGYS